MTAGFISSAAHDPEIIASYRHDLDKILSSNRADYFIGCVILADVALTIIEIDARAAGTLPPISVEALSMACYIIYLIEFCARLLARGLPIFLDFWSQLDFVVLLVGALQLVVDNIGQMQFDTGFIRILRIARIMRLARVVRKFRYLSELRKLMQMMGSCMKTLMWSILFCFMVMTVWSMIAVEMIYPLIQDMTSEGEFEDCEGCRRALGSVMRANLLLFQTVVAGDSWGLLAVRVIEVYPLSALVFMGSQMTLAFGVLNLVVAVVVDSAAEQRQKDIKMLAEDMDMDCKKDLKFLEKVFAQIDKDGSGELDLEELIQGAKAVPEFRDRLRVMDIDAADLEQLFVMLDVQNRGLIAPAQFINALSRWVFDSKTANRFIKYNMLRSMQMQTEMQHQMNTRLDQLDGTMRQLMSNGDTGLPASVSSSIASDGLPEPGGPEAYWQRAASKEPKQIAPIGLADLDISFRKAVVDAKDRLSAGTDPGLLAEKALAISLQAAGSMLRHSLRSVADKVLQELTVASEHALHHSFLGDQVNEKANLQEPHLPTSRHTKLLARQPSASVPFAEVFANDEVNLPDQHLPTSQRTNFSMRPSEDSDISTNDVAASRQVSPRSSTSSLSSKGPQMAAILDGLLDRVESGTVAPADLRRDLASFRAALESDLQGLFPHPHADLNDTVSM
mmetsp:Transcript_13170/g.23523  ORF Transcript_13170/g.23523 Transcript_13170/m.23523 type:complete len:676 (+) Transcript_13170:217-2244(+)